MINERKSIKIYSYKELIFVQIETLIIFCQWFNEYDPKNLR
jgi:hypothetical protein